MSFKQLYAVLLEAARQRVRNGELTERRLAKLAGVSQPHLHNVLKGARALSAPIADRILEGLHIDIGSLMAESRKEADADDD